MTARLSAGVVILRRWPEGWRCLLLRAYRNWDFPKGLVEAGEEPLQAAIREAQEEAGLADLDFRFGTDFCATAPYAGGKVARYYLAESRAGDVVLPVSAELGRPEHHEFRWTDFAGARRLVVPRLLPVVDWAQRTAAG